MPCYKDRLETNLYRLMVIVQYVLHEVHWSETSWWFRWQKVLVWNKIVNVKWFLERTVGGDWRFNILSGSHLHSEPSDGWKFKGGQWPPTVPLDLRTQFNRTIKFYPSMFLLGSNHFLWQSCFWRNPWNCFNIKITKCVGFIVPMLDLRHIKVH